MIILVAACTPGIVASLLGLSTLYAFKIPDYSFWQFFYFSPIIPTAYSLLATLNLLNLLQ